MPLFAIVCSRLILKERQAWRVYLSLLPITAGVIIATLTELSFNMTGMLSALLSTAIYALLNIIAKRVCARRHSSVHTAQVYHDTNIHPLLLLNMSGRIAAFLLLPIWCWWEATSVGWQLVGARAQMRRIAHIDATVVRHVVRIWCAIVHAKSTIIHTHTPTDSIVVRCSEHDQTYHCDRRERHDTAQSGHAGECTRHVLGCLRRFRIQSGARMRVHA
jgi:hypothetical protein